MKQSIILKLFSTEIPKHFADQDGILIADRSTKLYTDYCKQYKDDPAARKKHTEGMIYAGIALYRALQEKGNSPEKALEMTDKFFEDLTQRAVQKLQKILRVPGLYRLIPRIFRTFVTKQYPPEAGFKMKFYEVGNQRVKFDVVACPYYETCKSMGCPELTTVFCNTDDWCYGHMHPNLKWNRTKTIGRGSDLCDFDIAVKK